MKTTAVACWLAAAALAGAARAQEAQKGPTVVEPLTVQASLNGLMGNTIVDRAPGEVIWIQLHRDGAYDTYFNGRWASHGSWTYAKGQLCYSSGKAPGFCAREDLAGKKVGDTWVTIGPDGKRYDSTVVQGQQGG